jgi:sterol desaturase/sphingolipid hydroxylase (fatty acid hydroxylase superfamily)
MPTGLFAEQSQLLESAFLARRVLPLVLLVLFWSWESLAAFFQPTNMRVKHAFRNLSVALLNSVVLGVGFTSITILTADWARKSEFGVLPAIGLAWPARFVMALVLMDGWMYVWHRANHAIPLLWRFHRMHHSDRQMDVTTATRFHLGELAGASVLRLLLIPVLGLEVWHLVVYDALAVAVTQFHHANVSIGRADRWLRWLIVTPDMHKVHHSDLRRETDSNYSTVLSLWDRLLGSFRMREDPRELVFGLGEFTAPCWQEIGGMLKTPFVSSRDVHRPPAGQELQGVAPAR